MPVISRSIPKLARALTIGACLSAAVPGCAVFGGGGPSTVAQGKYYSSGNPQYDEFFIALYQLQVEMAEAPQAPNSERQSLAQALGLAPETPVEGVLQRLREEALKLGRTGIHMRLERGASTDKPEAATATIHATYRPKDDASANLIAKVEGSATNLLRTAGSLKTAQLSLDKLGVDALNLDAGVPKAFAEARVGTQSEVRKNLADAQKLITLMKARGDDVSASCEELLAAISKAVNTDDGSLNAPPEAAAEPAQPASLEPKKGAQKAHAKPKAVSPVPASGAPASAPKPKPNPASAPTANKPKPSSGDDDAPAKAAAPSKPAPPPRDFEP